MKIFSSALSSGWSFYARYLKCGRQMGWTPVPMNCCQWNTTLCTSTSQWISAYSQRSRKGEHQAGYRKWQHILFVVAAAAADGQHTAWKSTSVAQKKVSPHSISLVSWESFCETGLEMGTDLRPGPGVLVCTFFWDVCKFSCLGWSSGRTWTKSPEKKTLQVFLNFWFVVVGRQHCHNLKRSRPVFAL